MVRAFREGDDDDADRADGLLQPDLHLRRRALPRRRQGGRRRRADRRRPAARGGRGAVPPGARGRAQLHPPGDADHRRQAPAGGAREHLGLRLLRLDHRHHRRGRARRRASVADGGRAHQAPHRPAGRGRLRRADRRAGARDRRAAPTASWSARRSSTRVRASLDADGKATADARRERPWPTLVSEPAPACVRAPGYRQAGRLQVEQAVRRDPA